MFLQLTWGGGVWGGYVHTKYAFFKKIFLIVCHGQARVIRQQGVRERQDGYQGAKIYFSLKYVRIIIGKSTLVKLSIKASVTQTKEKLTVLNLSQVDSESSTLILFMNQDQRRN